MKKRFWFFILAVAFGAAAVCPAQNTAEWVEGRTWMDDYKLSPPTGLMVFRYDRYSLEDTVKFRQMIDLLNQSKTEGEWEGSYIDGGPDTVGSSVLKLSPKAGYAAHYVYTCTPELRWIDYGKVVETADTVELIPEFVPNSPRKSEAGRYVKVRWKNYHFLVAETALIAFAEKAAGIYVDPESTDDSPVDHKAHWSNFWTNWVNDPESWTRKDLLGLPEFPSRFRSSARSAIETRIVSVERRKIETDLRYDGVVWDERGAVYPVTLEFRKGLKKGVELINPRTRERVFITEIVGKLAKGVIVRSLNENGVEDCRNVDGVEIRCAKIVAGAKVKSETGKMRFW